MQKCKLCNNEKKLLQSHVVPKFVFKWMQKTGGNYFRTSLNPNKRAQDGFKDELLCNDCEQLFSINEKWFSEKIFYPYLDSNQNTILYTEELPKFIISILWRVLLFINKDKKNEIFNDVLREWQKYLISNTKPEKYDKIHLMFIPENWGMESQPHQYISRYFNRVADIGLIELENDTIVYSKFARFFLFSELKKSTVNFRATEIYFESGITMNGQYIMNEEISNFFINRSYKVHKYMEENTSEKQKEVISSEINKNMDNLLKKDLGRILKQDVFAKIGAYEFDPTFLYICDCCNKTIREPEGHLLRTFEVIQSEKYWKFVFNKLGYGIDELGLTARLEYFKKILSFESPWVICDTCISKYFAKNKENKSLMKKWIANKGEYTPPKNSDFRKYLTQDDLKRISLIIVTVE